MITQKRLHDLFEYREDGNLIWKVSLNRRIKIGDVAGSRNNLGYKRTQIENKEYGVHRMIFLYHHGYLTPGMEIDHIDGKRANNRIENLREVTHAQNLLNSKTASNNTSGIKGVYSHSNKWVVKLSIKGKLKYLGRYTTLEEAKAVVREAREKYHGEYARHE